MPGWHPSPPASDPSSEGPPPPRPTWTQGILDYLAARAELFHLESREAARQTIRQVVLVILLLLSAFFAYALLLTALVASAGAGLTRILPENLAPFGWIFASLAAALLHGLAAALLVRRLRNSSQSPLFPATRSEFEKDRQWIRDQQNNKNKS